MRLSGYQPQYFPRLHYLNRLLNSDIFEISDYIQFVKKHAFLLPGGIQKRGKSFQAHSPVKLASGLHFLVIPLPDDLLPINKIKIKKDINWVNKHLGTLETAYSKTPNFRKIFPAISSLLSDNYSDLAALNTATLLLTVKFFITEKHANEITVDYINHLLAKQNIFRLKKIVIASQTSVAPPGRGKANEWIVSLCRYLNADEYYYGGSSDAAYMDPAFFKKNNIATLIQNWKCPLYRQQYPEVGFIENLSALDLIMNEPLSTRQKLIQ